MSLSIRKLKCVSNMAYLFSPSLSKSALVHKIIQNNTTDQKSAKIWCYRYDGQASTLRFLIIASSTSSHNKANQGSRKCHKQSLGYVYSWCCTSMQQWKIWENMLHATCCTCCICNSCIVHSHATHATCCIHMQHLQQKQKCVQHRRKCT